MPLIKILICYLSLLVVAQVSAQSIAYEQDIKPIISKNCINCHREGEAGAMPLTNYEEVSAYGSMIQYVTQARLMPPWYADTTYRHFSNERSMTPLEIDQIKRWVENGMPEGTPSKQTTLSTTVFTALRKPDVTISMLTAFEQYGIFMDQYQVFVLPIQFGEDKWIEGIEFMPGNKKIVRYASISVDTSGQSAALDQWDPRYGYYSFGGIGFTASQPYWYTWNLQQPTTFYPSGTAKRLPKNAKLILHIQYGPAGSPQLDSSSVRLYFSKQKPKREIITSPLINPPTLISDSLFVPANTKKIFHASYTLPYDIEVMSLTPQANLICRSWEVYAKIPGEELAVKLLKIKDWNFTWKETYRFASPIHLPQGTVIHAQALYDNTTDNPCNPSDRPVDIREGSHLFSELFFVHFEFLK